MVKEKISMENYIAALQELHSLGFLKGKQDFTSKIGQQLEETIYDGKRAESVIQNGWDIDVSGYNILIKAHAKAEGNNNCWSAFDSNKTEKIDELFVIEF